MADKDMKFVWHGQEVADAMREAAKDGLRAAGVVLLRSMQDTVGVNGGGVPSAPGEPPRKQSGGLQRSLVLNEDRPAGVVRVGTRNPLGRWMEFGVNVRPKRAKMLAVPLNRAARRMFAGLGLLEGGERASLRNKPLTLITSKAGNLVLLEHTATGKIKKNGAAFVLKSFVRVAARPWLWVSYNRARARMNDAFRTETKLSVKRRLHLK